MRRGLPFLLCLTLMAFLWLSGCSPDGWNKDFVIGQNGLPASLDPQLETGRGGASLCAALYAGLLLPDGKGGLVSDCAERYEVSPDGKTYTFYLRENLVWSDGQPLVSADFAFGLKRCLAPETGSSIASELMAIQGAEAYNRTGKGSLGLDSSDPAVLILRLAYPDEGLPHILATPYCAPCNETFFESTGGRYGLSLATSLTNGRFTPVSMGKRIIAKKNKLFYDAKNVAPASITFTDLSGQTSDKIVNSLKEGNLDYAQTAGLPYIMPDSVTVTPLKGSVWTVSFSGTDELASMSSLRTALAVGGLSLAQAENNAGYFLPPQYRQQVLEGAGTVRGQNTAAARAALQETIKTLKKSSLPKVTLLVADREDARTLSDTLIENWQRELGIFISREFVDESQLRSRLRTGRYQLALSLFSPTVTSPSAFYSSLADAYQIGSSAIGAEYGKLLGSGNESPAQISAKLENLLFSFDGLYPLSYGQTYFLKNIRTQGELFHPGSGIIDLGSAKK